MSPSDDISLSPESTPAVAAIDLVGSITAYQQSALIGTAVETGLADALTDGPKTLDQLVRELGTDGRGTLALLAGLAGFDMVQRDGDRYRLTPQGELLGSDHPDSVAQIVRKEWFFYRLWADLPDAVRTGHAQTGPWRERLDNDPSQALTFLRALDDLCTLFGGELPGLAEIEGPGTLIDIGGGAGSHAANLVAENPELRATVLDLPGAEPALRERHPELDFVAGDFDLPRFGRPEGEEWDYVLLSNILHDHPAETNERLMKEAASLLSQGGSVIVYEWVIDPGRMSPEGVAKFTAMMVVENEGGWTWTESEIGAWMESAGLEPQPIVRGSGPIAVVRASRGLSQVGPSGNG